MNLDPITQIARVAHEANREYCRTLGDTSQKEWDLAPTWQQASARHGVEAIIAGKVRGPGDSHASWLAEKKADGWVYGPEKDEVKKTHHCMVPFEQLPQEQRAKDYLFFAVVSALIQASRS